MLKITKEIEIKDDEGNVIGKEIEESFNDCYRSFCMAWDTENKACTYFFPEAEEDEEEEDD